MTHSLNKLLWDICTSCAKTQKSIDYFLEFLCRNARKRSKRSLPSAARAKGVFGEHVLGMLSEPLLESDEPWGVWNILFSRILSRMIRFPLKGDSSPAQSILASRRGSGPRPRRLVRVQAGSSSRRILAPLSDPIN